MRNVTKMPLLILMKEFKLFFKVRRILKLATNLEVSKNLVQIFTGFLRKKPVVKLHRLLFFFLLRPTNGTFDLVTLIHVALF